MIYRLVLLLLCSLPSAIPAAELFVYGRTVKYCPLKVLEKSCTTGGREVGVDGMGFITATINTVASLNASNVKAELSKSFEVEFEKLNSRLISVEISANKDLADMLELLPVAVANSDSFKEMAKSYIDQELTVLRKEVLELKRRLNTQ